MIDLDFFDVLWEATAAPSTSTAVPGKWDMAIDGLELMLADGPQFRTIDTLRQQQSVGEAAEVSLNPEGFWRRSQSSWHLGAGQSVFDGPESSRFRFRDSYGVDVWEKYQLSLLPEAVLHTASENDSGSKILLCQVGQRSYMATKNAGASQVLRLDDTTTLTGISNTYGPFRQLCSTGSWLLIGTTANGIWKHDPTTSSASQWITDAVTPSVVAFVKGRVIVCVGGAVYNPVTAFTSSGALPAALYTHPDAAWTWIGAAEGLSHIYLAGYAGEKSVIYKTAVKPDGTALDIPSVAGRLPEGERITGIYGYLGTVVIGTTEGVRVAVANDGSGDLTIGALAEIPGGTTAAFYGYRTGVYFGLTSSFVWGDGITRAGVGRIDLANLADPQRLLPAWATDRAGWDQPADVDGVIAPGGVVWFAVDGRGVYRDSEAGNVVESGWLRVGQVSFDVAEDKVVTGARASWVGEGLVTVALANRGGMFNLIAASGEQIRGDVSEMKVILDRSVNTATAGPTVKTVTTLAIPAPAGTYLIVLNAELAEAVMCRDGMEARIDVDAAFARLRAMWSDKRIVTLQLGRHAHAVTIERFHLAETRRAETSGVWNGVIQLTCKVVA